MIYLHNIPKQVPADIARELLEQRMLLLQERLAQTNWYLERERYASITYELGTVYLEYMDRYFNPYLKFTIPSNV